MQALQMHQESEDAVQSVWLLIRKTPNRQDEQILEQSVQKIVLMKESEVWFPNKKCENADSLSWWEPVDRATMMEKPYTNNKMEYDMLLLVGIFNIEL